MIEIYAIRIDESIDEEMYEKLLLLVSKDKCERIRRFRFIEDSKRTLFADILVRYLACQKTNCNNKNLIFIYNKFGKSFLKNPPNFYFNISHSENWVVCAISNKEVGIDIEKIKPIDLDIAKRFFSKIEYEDLMSKQLEKQISYFYDLWTLKESYIKYKGKGLSIPLNSFSLNVNENDIFITSEDQIRPNFKQFKIDKEYKLSICGEDNDFDNDIKYLSYENIFKEILIWI
ncbi:4'-phosphopantetheinyl transferase [Clostridium cavendishii DSM 21758]|uniref:4'-phosphopantetheinyl transferase n=1 Tax=Clostridium cavendishii DSM 21758 TaxID=1121302 RepID=A0A1M6MU38_9CLOT|nr:4'-phosphopantetheinyl transferase superfamily protein [Clostridium cavendishii]SHJ86932.1 4'-phosphopantetheinyl transferase [Clostridium cavendishii DSM 21758]